MKVITVPCSFDNYAYILLCEVTGKAAVIDPSEAYPVIMAAEKAGGELVAVLCTHHHADHVGDLEYLLEEIPAIEVCCHESDEMRIHGANRLLDNGDRFSLGNLEVTVYHTPGHTSGSVVYQVDDALFTGDTLFGAGCGRLFEGTPQEMYGSLNRLKELPEICKIYFGHEYTQQNLTFAMSVEPDNEAIQARFQDLEKMEGIVCSTPSTLELEIATNPFMRCDQFILPGCNSPLEVFTRLRKLKDKN